MDNEEQRSLVITIIIIIIGTIVTLFILHAVIRSATRSISKLRETRKQTLLLKEIAKKNGVDETTIAKIDDDKLYENI